MFHSVTVLLLFAESISTMSELEKDEKLKEEFQIVKDELEILQIDAEAKKKQLEVGF